MEFCFEYCSDLMREKNVFVIEKNNVFGTVKDKIEYYLTFYLKFLLGLVSTYTYINLNNQNAILNK